MSKIEMICKECNNEIIFETNDDYYAFNCRQCNTIYAYTRSGNAISIELVKIGIRIPNEIREAYTILDLPISCRSQDEIKKGRRKQIELYHPDKVNNLGKEFIELANEKTKDINMAYEILISWLNCNDNYYQANEKNEYNDSKNNEEEKDYARNQWICPKCNTKNSNYAFLCTKCGYLNQKQWENGQ